MLIVSLGMPVVNLYIFSVQSKLNISVKKEKQKVIGLCVLEKIKCGKSRSFLNSHDFWLHINNHDR